MSFDDVERRVSTAVMRHLRNTSAVLTPPGGNSVTVDEAHYSEPHHSMDGGEVTITTTQPTLHVLESDLSQIPENDWEVEIGSRLFRVIEARPDSTGLIEIALEEIS